MIGEHVHTVSFLKNIMDQADMMTENTAIVISQESEGLVEVETNFEAKLVFILSISLFLFPLLTFSSFCWHLA